LLFQAILLIVYSTQPLLLTSSFSNGLTVNYAQFQDSLDAI